MRAPIGFRVEGRPAPQGSKLISGNGAMREASAYLPAWRAAVKLAAYERYRELGIVPEHLPWFTGPVAVRLTFWLDGERADVAPDIDKLTRSTLDALGGSKRGARAFDDDARVVALYVAKVVRADHPAGASIAIEEAAL